MKYPKLSLALGLALLWIASALPAGAQVRFLGSTSWATYGSQVGLYADEIQNNTTGTTGTLQLQLWATSSPYSGGTISGYLLGTYNLNPLSPGYYYSSVAGVVGYSAPPAGYYYVTLALGEYNGSVYPIVNYVTYPTLTTFGSPTFPPPVAPAPVYGAAALDGPVKVSFSGSKVLITYKEIQPAGDWNTYGLQVRLMAGKTKAALGNTGVFDDGVSYTQIASFPLSPLPPGAYYPKNTVTKTWKELKKGKYYLYVVVSQDYPAPDGWKTDSFIQVPGQWKF